MRRELMWMNIADTSGCKSDSRNDTPGQLPKRHTKLYSIMKRIRLNTLAAKPARQAENLAAKTHHAL